MRRILTGAALVVVMVTASGCAGFFGRPATARTFSQQQAGNVIASDSLGSHMRFPVHATEAAAPGE